jgi:hypothetical protein
MERLRDPLVLDILRRFLAQHLGQQYIERPHERENFSEADKLRLMPLVFGLMPLKAAVREDLLLPIKPLIRDHLAAIGVPQDELLADLIKDLCDNYAKSSPEYRGDVRRRQKARIADLRAQPRLYRSIRERQHARCVCCGVSLVGAQVETLDHVIPWRLGGDPEAGCNWQLMCETCNSGKAEFLSSACLPEFQNWAYSDTYSNSGLEDRPCISRRLRYLVVSYYRHCQHPGCTASPQDSKLSVVRNPHCQTGFFVFDHLTVRCEDHIDGDVSAICACGAPT